MKALIIHVGNKYTRAIKSIEHIKPDLVYFIYNEGYDSYIEKINNESNVNFQHKSKLIDNFQSIEDSYSVSKEIFKELINENYEIHVGVSNGTKAMVAGLSLASVGYDCNFLYVGSTPGGRDKEGTGDVIPGFEKVLSEFHPMKKQAIIEISRGKRYFNKYQFDEALDNFKQAKFILNDNKLIDIYIKIAYLYKYWDKFENLIPRSKRNLNAKVKLDSFLIKFIIKEIESYDTIYNEFIFKEKEFFEKLKLNFKFLDKKISKKGLIEENDIYYYLVDLLNNAQRRINEEKYDDATARLYRISELIAQIRLYELGLVDKDRLRNNKVFHIDKLKLIEIKNLKAIEYVAKQPDFQNPEEKTVKLALKNSYELLNILNDDLAKRFLEDKELDNVLSNRNNSILAHGLNPSDKENTIKLFYKLKEYSKETFEELEKYISFAEFPEFLDISL